MDKLTPKRRSENMRRIRSKDTTPEMVVRRIAHYLGYRFRLHRRDLPGKPDLVFPSRRKAVFVHGCFWHQHPNPRCLDARPPKTNTEYWTPKLERNLKRDKEHVRALRQNGWTTLVIWECETKKAQMLETRLVRFLGPN